MPPFTNCLVVSLTIFSSSSECLCSIVEGGGAEDSTIEAKTLVGASPFSMRCFKLSTISKGSLVSVTGVSRGRRGRLQKESRAANALATGDVLEDDVGVEYPEELEDEGVGVSRSSGRAK